MTGPVKLRLVTAEVKTGGLYRIDTVDRPRRPGDIVTLVDVFDPNAVQILETKDCDMCLVLNADRVVVVDREETI